MVIVLIILLVLFVGLAYRAYWLDEKVFKEKGSLTARIAELEKNKEEVDAWKKSCWAAEKCTLDIQNAYKESESQLIKTKIELEKVINQKKSSEVRTGLIAEQMAPFIDNFPYNPKDAHFLGRPLDFIVFTDDYVRFVEVKSGEAKLTDVQRKVRKNIEEGRVSFEVFKISGR